MLLLAITGLVSVAVGAVEIAVGFRIDLIVHMQGGRSVVSDQQTTRACRPSSSSKVGLFLRAGLKAKRERDLLKLSSAQSKMAPNRCLLYVDCACMGEPAD